jgi:hypothetical protein
MCRDHSHWHFDACFSRNFKNEFKHFGSAKHSNGITKPSKQVLGRANSNPFSVKDISLFVFESKTVL